MRLRNQQKSPYSEKDLIEITKSNLKPSLSHLLFSVTINNLNDFWQQAKRAETLLANQKHLAHSLPRVHEIGYEDDTTPPIELDVEALTTGNRLTCWNCRQNGHSFSVTNGGDSFDTNIVPCPVLVRMIEPERKIEILVNTNRSRVEEEKYMIREIAAKN